jgi:carbamoyl-phosphate synthase small subunit
LTDPAILALEDGTVFYGASIGVPGRTLGEVVFNTAMTGYQEILTDPSYYRQLVTLTYPHIGNVGTNSEDQESGRAYAAGLIIRALSPTVSSWRAEGGLGRFLTRAKTVAIADIDTRKLTRIIRDKGALAGCIMAGENLNEDEAIAAAKKFPGLKGMDLAKLVTTKDRYQWNQGLIWPPRERVYSKRAASHHVVAYDFGIKRNILRLLAEQDSRVTVVPATTPASEVLALDPDGVFLSNGPGDPEPCDYAIAAIKEIVDRGVPVFGICLGHQLLALASGAKTVKMKFGHHGANHPVQELDSGRVLITSQNHGFSVDGDSLGDTLRATHRSLFDQTLQGIERTDVPAFGFQGHPEASPGPHDVGALFERFTLQMRLYRRQAPDEVEVNA